MLNDPRPFFRRPLLRSVVGRIGAWIIPLLNSTVLLQPMAAHAASPKTPCPRYIAEKSGEIFYPRENFRCFASTRDAERAGYVGMRSLVNPDYSGWWRWNLSLASNTCGGERSSNAATTYFLQLKQDSSSGLFGSLCPGSETFIGALPVKDPAIGFSITSSTQVLGDPFCNGGTAVVSYVMEARDFDPLFTAAKSAKLTQIKSCMGESDRRCRATWRGSGGRETTDHRFWPQISNNINEFGQNCGAALATCQSCHAAPAQR